MISEKVALVLQGGGARGIFVAGVTDALLDAGLEFPYVIGTSAGSLVGYNVVAKERGRAKEVIIKGMRDKRFAGYSNLIRTKSFFNFDFLFNDLPKEIPFSFESFEESKAQFYCCCTGVEDGCAHYFEKSRNDFNDCVAASSTLPFFGRPVRVGDEPYMDGSASFAIPFRKPFLDGYDKIVVVLTRAREYRKKEKKSLVYRSAAKIKYRKYPKYLASLIKAGKQYNGQMDELFALEKQGKAFLIFPKHKPVVGVREKDEKKLEDFYLEGLEVGRESIDRLKEFLEGGK